MTNTQPTSSRAVWFDLPVVDLERANTFYAAVLGCAVELVEMEGMRFSVLEHGDQGVGGCLVPKPEEISPDKGILLYLNVDGRIRAAVGEVQRLGGTVLEPVHSIGPHGFRALVLDSEGNRVALHSASDA